MASSYVYIGACSNSIKSARKIYIEISARKKMIRTSFEHLPERIDSKSCPKIIISKIYPEKSIIESARKYNFEHLPEKNDYKICPKIIISKICPKKRTIIELEPAPIYT